MTVIVLIANEGEKVKVCEVYSEKKTAAAYKRFDDLKRIYGGANCCLASRKVL